MWVSATETAQGRGGKGKVYSIVDSLWIFAAAVTYCKYSRRDRKHVL